MADKHESPDALKLLTQVDWVRALARSLVEDVNDADDLAQEALLGRGPTPRWAAAAGRSQAGFRTCSKEAT